MKKVYLVYQDCPMCGSRKNWGLEQTTLATKKGVEIVKCPFYSNIAIENQFCSRAVAKKIGKMPFFTDGEKFGYDLADILEEEPKTTKSSAKTTKTTKKVAKSAKKEEETEEEE